MAQTTKKLSPGNVATDDKKVEPEREIAIQMSEKGRESSDEEVYDPESEGPYLSKAGEDIDDDIGEEFEHGHNRDVEEFQLIPHHTDKDKWKIFIPVVYWFPKYKWKSWFLSDVIAAVTAIVMVIPQGMGYALVAGLQPIYGLYSALMGHCLYGPFGTSGQLIVAPVAIVSLMTKETLHAYEETLHGNPEKYAAYGSALAFQVGVFSLVLGLFQAGILANMLAEPVIVGFTFAAAILIGMSQLEFILKIHVEGENLILKVIDLIKNIKDAHVLSILLAFCCIVFLLILRTWKNHKNIPGSKFAKFIPGPLILVVIATAISATKQDKTGWDVVGTLPKGLPKFVNFFDNIEMGDFYKLMLPSLLITILAFIESIAVAIKFADKHDYSIDASQELVALGICNLVGCWFQIYPVSGVLSLATVVEAAGATTPLYSIMAGIGMIFCTAFLLRLFEWLPKPVLGSIVLVGIINLIDLGKMKEIWKVNRRDTIVLAITILVTLLLGIDYGVALGVVVSMILFIQRAAKPHYGVLGKLKTSAKGNVYRNVKHFPLASKRGDMLIIRWDASIFFANIQSFKTRIRKHIGRFLNDFNYPTEWCLVLCFSGVNDIDYTGVEGIKQFVEELQEKETGITIVLCKVKKQVEEVLERGHVIDIIGKSHILWELHQAEHWWDKRLKFRGSTIQSPNKTPMEPIKNEKQVPKIKGLSVKKRKKKRKYSNDYASKDDNNEESVVGSLLENDEVKLRAPLKQTFSTIQSEGNLLNNDDDNDDYNDGSKNDKSNGNHIAIDRDSK